MAELKFVSWPEIMALRNTSRTIFEKIREAATIRANPNGEGGFAKRDGKTRNVMDKLFGQYQREELSARVIQRQWRKRIATSAESKKASMSDRCDSKQEKPLDS